MPELLLFILEPPDSTSLDGFSRGVYPLQTAMATRHSSSVSPALVLKLNLSARGDWGGTKGVVAPRNDFSGAPPLAQRSSPPFSTAQLTTPSGKGDRGETPSKTRLYQCVSSCIDPRTRWSAVTWIAAAKVKIFRTTKIDVMRFGYPQTASPTYTKKTRRWLFCAPNLTQLAVGRLCRR